jgi:hypothetical protein
MSSKRLLGFLKYCEKCAPNLPTFHHVAEDEVLVGDTVAAEDVASHAGAV